MTSVISIVTVFVATFMIAFGYLTLSEQEAVSLGTPSAATTVQSAR